MKKTSTFLVLVLFVITLNSCGGRETQIRDTAQGFLDSYLSAQFDSAAKFCTPELLSSGLDSMSAPFAGLDSAALELFKRQIAGLHPEIISVEKRLKKDSIEVKYKITTDSNREETKGVLTVVKTGDSWKVGKLGE